MQTLRRWTLTILVGVLLASLASSPNRPSTTTPKAVAEAPPVPAAAHEKSPAGPPEIVGRTHVPLTHKGALAATVLRPIVAVLAAPGERVKKGQVIIQLNDREAHAKVKARTATLETARVAVRVARALLTRGEEGYKSGVVSDVRYLELRNNVRRDEAEERAAQADLTAAEVEQEFYKIKAPLDGTIAWLEAYPGVVGWPGSSIWGEVVDLKQLDVQCDVTPTQADQIALGQEAEVQPYKAKGTYGVAKVIFVGTVAERKTGLVPVALRLPNPHERVRAEVAVAVRFRDAGGK